MKKAFPQFLTGTAGRSVLMAFVVAVGAHTAVRSQQSPAPRTAATPQAPPLTAQVTALDPATMQSLQALKAANDKLLQQQESLMKRLDAVAEQVRQLRIFARRT